MRRKFGNHRVDLGIQSTRWTVHQTWRLVYVGIKKGTNKWIYDLTDHLMVDLETTIALASMTYIIDSDVNELHPGDEKVFNDIINDS